MKRFRIWWSPMGAPNGSKEIEAKDHPAALALAIEEMRQHGPCGAYGADELNQSK